MHEPTVASGYDKKPPPSHEGEDGGYRVHVTLKEMATRLRASMPSLDRPTPDVHRPGWCRECGKRLAISEGIADARGRTCSEECNGYAWLEDMAGP